MTGCNYVNLEGHKCEYNYELRNLLFRNPITKESKEIEICPRHFKETVDEPLIMPLKELFRKRDNLFAKQNRERSIAKREGIVLLPNRAIELDKIKDKIRKYMSFRCSNILCGTSISNLNPVYSMIIISNLGKVSHKFYFCTRQCWDKMRIRTGAIIPPKETKNIPLKVFMEEQ